MGRLPPVSIVFHLFHPAVTYVFDGRRCSAHQTDRFRLFTKQVETKNFK